MKLLPALLAVWTMMSCGAGQKPVVAATESAKPDAGKLFEMRNRCASLADKMEGKYRRGVPFNRNIAFTNHYDQATGMCYAEVMGYESSIRSREVFDAQEQRSLIQCQDDPEYPKNPPVCFDAARSQISNRDATSTANRLMGENDDWPTWSGANPVSIK